MFCSLTAAVQIVNGFHAYVRPCLQVKLLPTIQFQARLGMGHSHNRYRTSHYCRASTQGKHHNPIRYRPSLRRAGGMTATPRLIVGLRQ